MATVTVDYILNLKGTASKALDDLKVKMAAFGAQANKTARELNSNQMVSTIESVASIFTQFGGTVSQVAIITSTAARPLAVMQKMLGSTAIAAGAAVAGVALLTIGIVKATGATMTWIGEMGKVRSALIDQGYLVAGDARNLVEYERAMSRLSVSTDKLRVEMADKLAPAFQELIDAATGFVRVLGDINGSANTARGSISNLLATAGQSIGGFAGTQLIGASAAIKGLSVRGSTTEVDWSKYGPQKPSESVLDKIEQTRQLGAMPEYDPTAVGNLRKQQNETNARKAEAELMALIQEAIAADQQELAVKRQRLEAEIALYDLSQAQYREAQAFQSETEAIVRQMEAATADFERRQASSGMSMSGGLAGTVSSMTGGAVSLGPIGIVVGLFNGLVDELFNLPDLLGKTLESGIKLFTQTDELVKGLVGQLIPAFIRAMPEIIAGFVTFVPQIAAELIQAAPIIMSAVVEAILQLPLEIAKAFVGIFDFGRLGETLGGVGQMFGIGKGNGGVLNAVGRLTGTDLATKGEKRLFGVKLPSFDTGGMVAKSGLAQVHAGERVLTRQETRNYSGGSVGTINVFGVADARTIAEDLRNKLGPYGLGLTLTPRTG